MAGDKPTTYFLTPFSPFRFPAVRLEGWNGTHDKDSVYAVRPKGLSGVMTAACMGNRHHPYEEHWTGNRLGHQPTLKLMF